MNDRGWRIMTEDEEWCPWCRDPQYSGGDCEQWWIFFLPFLFFLFLSFSLLLLIYYLFAILYAQRVSLSENRGIRSGSSRKSHTHGKRPALWMATNRLGLLLWQTLLWRIHYVMKRLHKIQGSHIWSHVLRDVFKGWGGERGGEGVGRSQSTSTSLFVSIFQGSKAQRRRSNKRWIGN